LWTIASCTASFLKNTKIDFVIFISREELPGVQDVSKNQVLKKKKKDSGL